SWTRIMVGISSPDRDIANSKRACCGTFEIGNRLAQIRLSAQLAVSCSDHCGLTLHHEKDSRCAFLKFALLALVLLFARLPGKRGGFETRFHGFDRLQRIAHVGFNPHRGKLPLRFYSLPVSHRGREIRLRRTIAQRERESYSGVRGRVV